MRYHNTGAETRPTPHSPFFHSGTRASVRVPAASNPATAILSRPELQRLVAAMVD
jgi:hypothetical protein